MSNFSFSHSVFKRLVSQGRQKVSLCGNGLKDDSTKFYVFLFTDMVWDQLCLGQTQRLLNHGDHFIHLEAILEVGIQSLLFNPFPNNPWFLAPLAEGQRAIVMAWGRRASVRPFVRACVRKLFL